MLISDLKLLLRFKNTSLYEEVSNTTMQAFGDSTFPRILSGGGYIMANNQYLLGEGGGNTGFSTSISNAMTLGFWLYPVNPGMATNPSSGAAVSVSMPVLDFYEIEGSDYDATIRLKENTTADGKNNLTVSFNDDAYYASSEDYDPLKWHYFWIVYDGSSPSLSIYIDGKQHALQSVVGSVPSLLKGSLLYLYINHRLDGYAYNIAKNYGYISDIFMMNIINTSETDMQRVINNGVEYLVDSSYTDSYIDKSSIYFNDPDTIIVTSSIDDMGYVYLGRNDGKILRGSPLLWETRRSFANDEEINLLGLSSDDKGQEADDSWDLVGGFLELKNKSIRL